MVKIFSLAFLTIIILLSIASVFALVILHISLSNYSCDLSPEGINRYLFSFSVYKTLFIATITSIASYFGLLRLKAATDANIDKLRNDRFSEWKLVSEVRFLQYEKENDYMKREFIKRRYNLFQELFKLKFSIKNKVGLILVFDKYFKNSVQHFEEQNDKCLWMGATYPNADFSYSFDAFQYVFRGCLEEEYDNLYLDLKELYMASLSTERTIDMGLYNSALTNFLLNRN